MIIQLSKEHCDILKEVGVDNKEEIQKDEKEMHDYKDVIDDDKAEKSSPMSTLVFGTICASVVILPLLAVALYALCKKEEKIDINPDYGYTEDGAEYVESVIQDTNMYYADGDEDPEYQNN